MGRADDPDLVATQQAVPGSVALDDTTPAAASAPRDDATLAGKRPRPAMAPARPTIGRFEIIRELGAGGMGAVYLATDPTLGRRVAIKVLHQDGAGDDAARRRLLREAQGTAQLAHEHVVVVHEVGTHDGQVYLAMEYVAGTTLRAWQHDRDWREVLAMYRRAGLGLQAAHDAGLVHRDFKPDNVLVGDDGRVRVTDFGLVAAVDAPAAHLGPEATALRGELDLAVSMTRTGTIMGTPRYMAPEQHLCEAVDARADQFAFCVALYDAWFHQPPFAGENYDVMVAHVLAGEIRSVPATSPVPSALADAVLRGLRRQRDDRFPSMAALLAALVEPAEVVAPEPPPPATVGAPPARRRRWPWLAVGAVTVASAAALLAIPRNDRPRGAPSPAAAAAACTAATCPPGAGCGADGTCRQPSGRYRVRGEPVAARVSEAAIADVDRDGRPDVYGYSASQLWSHAGQADGTLGPARALPLTFADPAFGDLDGDGVVDAVLAAPGGLQVAVGGQADHGFALTAQPSTSTAGALYHLVSLRARRGPPALIAITAAAASSDLVAVVDDAAALAVPLGDTAASQLELAGRVFAVDVDGDGGDELVLCSSDFARARVFAVAPARAGRVGLVARGDLALGAGLVSGVLVASVPGDRTPDLVAVHESDDGAHALVAAGTGGGRFAPAAPTPALDAAGRLYALADLDGDRRLDQVGARGVWLSSRGTLSPGGAPWTAAATVDVDGDGDLDVAAISQLGLELLVADGRGTFTRSRHLADRGLDAFERIRTGDFDGDRRGDLAVIARASGSDGPAEPLVVYGGAAGVSDDVRSLGRFDRFEQLVVHDVVAPGEPAPDAATDLLVQTAIDVGGAPAHQQFVFRGAADRAPVATFALGADPDVVAIGRFGGGDARADVLAVDGAGTAVLVRGNGGPRLSQADRAPLAIAGAPALPWCRHTELIFAEGRPSHGVLVADLDGDGQDELIGVPCDVAAVGIVQLGRFSGTASQPVLTLTDVRFAPPAEPGLSRVALADLDRDRAVDVAIAIGLPTPRLAVLWGDRAGLVPNPSTLPLGILNVGGVAAIQADADPALELFVSSLGADPRGGRVDVGADRALALGDSGVNRGNAVVAGDFDRDGVDDLVVAGGDKMRVLAGCPVDDPCP